MGGRSEFLSAPSEGRNWARSREKPGLPSPTLAVGWGEEGWG
jgi:hypothetical protein